MHIDEKTTEIKNLVQKWLSEMDVKIGVMKEDVSFGFVVDDLQGLRVLVYQNPNQPDAVLMTAVFEFVDEYAKKLLTQQASARKEMLWNLRFALLDTQMAFRIEGEPPKAVTLTTIIYSDGLTKDRFCHEFFKVRQANLRLLWMMDRALDRKVPTIGQAYVV